MDLNNNSPYFLLSTFCSPLSIMLLLSCCCLVNTDIIFYSYLLPSLELYLFFKEKLVTDHSEEFGNIFILLRITNCLLN